MVRYGNQNPTFEIVGKYHSSLGKEAVELFNDVGSTFYPCQEMELTLFLARTKDGRAASKTICISKPRQNGKSFSARHYAIWMSALENKKVLYSAHHGKTVRKMFKYICDMFVGYEDFRNLLKPGANGIYKAQGSEGIYLNDGGMIEFSTRTNSAGRGETYDVIIVDEAQELTDEQLDALKPTTLASDSGDPQIIYLGTPPNVKCPGTVFKRLHNSVHSGKSTSVWWLEWSVDEIPEDQTDKELWYLTNPALGYRIKEDVMSDAADTVSPDSFAREYLGWWTDMDLTIDSVISDSQWKQTITETPPMSGVFSYGVKFEPNEHRATLSGCIKPEEGTPHVDAIKSYDMLEGGEDELMADLMQRKEKAAEIWLDGKGYDERFKKMMLNSGFNTRQVKVCRSSDYVSACAALLGAIANIGVTHGCDKDLENSATKSARRKIGKDGWGFGSTGEADSTLIEACAIAYQAAMLTRRKAGRKARVG